MLSPFRPAVALVLAFLASTVGPVQGQALQSPARQILVVTNPASPATMLTAAQLRRIFLREETAWPDGSPITLFERPSDHPIRAAFGSTVHGKGPSQLAEYWLNLQLTSGLEPPRVCRTAALLKQYLDRMKGAVGYVYEDELIEGMKVVARVTPKRS